VSIPAARAASGIDHDANNRLTKWSNTTVNYDTNGNVTNDGTYSYTWNDRNELSDIKQSQTTVASFAYDPFGRRAKRVVDGTTTQYLHDGDNVIQEQNAAGSATADLLTGLGVDDTFARIESGTTTSRRPRLDGGAHGLDWSHNHELRLPAVRKDDGFGVGLPLTRSSSPGVRTTAGTRASTSTVVATTTRAGAASSPRTRSASPAATRTSTRTSATVRPTRSTRWGRAL